MLERATQIFVLSGSGPIDVAETRFDLAQALWHQEAARPRAIALADAARRAYAEAARTKEVAEIDAWLAERVDTEPDAP